MIDERAFKRAVRAFRRGAPGVVNFVVGHDSMPPEHEPVPTTANAEEIALRKFLTAYLNDEGLV